MIKCIKIQISDKFEDNFNCFIDAIKSKNDHRYLSWEYCYNHFQNNVLNNPNYDEDYAALMLGFYLASWGMYRGSSQLLKRFSFTIHKGAIKKIIQYRNELDRCYAELKTFYTQTFSMNGETIYPSDTLLTKIILGTTGQTPAYDRFFKSGIKCYNLMHQHEDNYEKLSQTFSNDNLKKIRAEFIHRFNIQSYIRPKTTDMEEMLYPLDKVIDIYFWNLGRKYEEKKDENTQQNNLGDNAGDDGNDGGDSEGKSQNL